MNSKEKDVDKAKEAKVLGMKVTGITIRCGASLVFASIGAGIGATLVRPSVGQWMGKHITSISIIKLSFLGNKSEFIGTNLYTSTGCAVGDLAGPIVVSFCLDRALHLEL